MTCAYSTQDTLLRQRDFACLFEVDKNWRADYVVVRCKARGVTRGFAGTTAEADCGAGLLCVGVYMEGDDYARAYAEDVAKRQQKVYRQLAEKAYEAQAKSASGVLASVGGMFASRAARDGAIIKIGAAVEAALDEHQEQRQQLPADVRDAGKEFNAVKQALRAMNGKKQARPSVPADRNPS